ncbi:dienelactone hydrolase [Chitinimonas prasina]|uniref:Dienelactone hydrolase n=1 Tax=Chitinimonas prasina TaxID=1434937 RepID=A0ABQ5YGY2_9NEIS|nr:hypothetical protein [Chitinimonas prasina]GLR13747.1 dienelactone hydrolase [Chitinimonas prasina]
MFKPCITALLCAATLPALAWNSNFSNVSFENAAGLTIPAKLFVPAGWVAGGNQRYPAVVMLHGCSGVYSYSLPNANNSNVQTLYREWADRLVAQNMVVLVVDSFSPRKPAGQNQSECNNGAGVGISEVTDRPLDVYAARSYLDSRSDLVSAGRMALLGWSHGGSTVMTTLADTEPDGTTSKPTAQRGFRGGVAFYPGCGLNSAYNGITNSKWRPYAGVHILAASADKLYYDASKATQALKYPCTTRQDRAAQLGASSLTGNEVQMTVYQGAAHSFDGSDDACVNIASTPDACAKEQADTAALNRLQQYLN